MSNRWWRVRYTCDRPMATALVSFLQAPDADTAIARFRREYGERWTMVVVTESL